MEEKLDYLSDVDLFRDLSERDMVELDRMTTITNVPRGRVFYQPEDVGEVLFLIKEGRVQLYRISPEGKKLAIATLGPGTLFGEMALLGQAMHNAFAEALDDCLILVMSRADLERLILISPSSAADAGNHRAAAQRRGRGWRIWPSRAFRAGLAVNPAGKRVRERHHRLTHQDPQKRSAPIARRPQVLNDMKAQGLIDTGASASIRTWSGWRGCQLHTGFLGRNSKCRRILRQAVV